MARDQRIDARRSGGGPETRGAGCQDAEHSGANARDHRALAALRGLARADSRAARKERALAAVAAHARATDAARAPLGAACARRQAASDAGQLANVDHVQRTPSDAATAREARGLDPGDPAEVAARVGGAQLVATRRGPDRRVEAKRIPTASRQLRGLEALRLLNCAYVADRDGIRALRKALPGCDLVAEYATRERNPRRQISARMAWVGQP